MKNTTTTTAQPLTGAELIDAERVRQIQVKKFDAEHDAGYTKGQLAAAGAAYALVAEYQTRYKPSNVQAVAPPRAWPWPGAQWKPSNSRLDNLVRAGALIAAEIDRLLTLGEKMPAAAPAATTDAAADKTLDLLPR